jgi:hypothetical protein
LFDLKLTDIVERSDKVAEQAADIMPTWRTSVPTVDYHSGTIGRDEVVPPHRQSVGPQHYNIATEDDLPPIGDDSEASGSVGSGDDEQISRICRP